MGFIDNQIGLLMQKALYAPPAEAANLYADVATLQELKEKAK